MTPIVTESGKGLVNSRSIGPGHQIRFDGYILLRTSDYNGRTSQNLIN